MMLWEFFISKRCYSLTTYKNHTEMAENKLKNDSEVYLAILTQGSIRKELALKLIKWCKNSPYKIFVNFTEEKPCAHARNHIVQKFLKSNNEWLIMIDEDVVPSQNPFELILLNKDVIICPTLIYQYKVGWNVYKTDANGYWQPIKDLPENDLIEIDAGGTGCILIKRNVLEKIKAPFERIFDENGIETMGLDLSFSKKAKEVGFKIFCPTDYQCSHFKTINLKNI